VAATWPILLIIAIIVALIIMFYKLIDVINEWTGATTSATGLIMGAIFVLAAFIYNTFIVNIWNAIADFINFFANVFKDPVASIKLLFLGLAETVLGYIAKIASGIESLLNKIPGVKVNITSGLDNLLANVKSAAQEVKDASEWVEVAKKLDQWDYKDAASQGYEVGKKIDDKLNSISLDSITGNLMPGQNDPFKNFNGVDKVGSIGEVGKIKNDVSLADEDLKMLVDMAERQYVANVNVKTLSPDVKIEVTNQNGEKIDEKKIASAVKQVLEEQVAMHTDAEYAY
jgi:phage-related protein